MFDELRIKRLLSKNLSKEDYLKLPNKFRFDERVKKHLLKCDPDSINIFDIHDLKKFVLEDYSLLSSLDEKNLNKVFMYLDLSKVEFTQELFTKLSKNGRNRVLNYSIDLFFELVPENEKIRELRKCINNYYLAKFENREFNLSMDKIKELVLGLNANELIELTKDHEYVTEYVKSLIVNSDFEKLYSLYEENNEMLSFYDDNTKMKISIIECKGNLELIKNLEFDAQVMYFKYNINQLAYAPRNVVDVVLMEYDKLDSSMLIKMYYAFLSEYVSRLSKEEQMKVFAYDFGNAYSCCHGYKAAFNLDDIMYDKICKINDVDKRKELLTFYKTLEDEKINDNDSYIYHNQKYQLSRMLYDDNIVNNNDISLLEKYRDTYDRGVLIEILSNAYGSHVIEIFNERPYLNLFDIDNFKVFDKKIYDKLGAGFIHYLLNCDMERLDSTVSKIVCDEYLFDKFVGLFNCISSTKENLDINFITNLFIKFKDHEEVLRNIDYDNLSLEQKNILGLFLNDDFSLTVSVQNADDLDDYLELRRKRFIEIGREADHYTDLKHIIFSYVTGRSVDRNDEVLDSLTLESAIKVFNIDNIVKNEDIIEKIGLSEDEVSILLLLNEINHIYNVDVLKNTFEALVNRNLDSVLFENTFNKIRDYYVEDVKKNLLSKENIESMPKEVIDSVEVVNFEGEDFSLICSVNNLDLSSKSAFTQPKSGKTLLDDWLNRENGHNIISTSLVSSDTEIYPLEASIYQQISSNMVFVFDSDVDIVGMGGTDISSEHKERSKTHYFEFISCSDHDTGFSTMDELKDRINTNKKESYNKFNSEITISRRVEDVRKEDSNKRVMPVGLYVIGDITEEHLKTAKAFNEYYEANGLGKFRIIRVNPLVYKGEGIKVPSEKVTYSK